jgi:O-antigen ligase
MARKKRTAVPGGLPGPAAAAVPLAASAGLPAPAAATGARGVPGEVVQGDWTVGILGAMMFLAPAVGVPHEEMLQDTYKSMLVALAALGAALLLFWRARERTTPLRWHTLLWAPLALMAYALGSMAWSHAYLAGVEAIRWFIFSLLLWLGLNTLDRERLPLLARGIHWGATVASLWAALQFWVDFKLFPQGPNPASTFINRNFFAEFVVCTLPFSVWLLARARSSSMVALLACSLGLNILALLMTGTRSALLALLLLSGVLPFILWRYRRLLPLGQWDLPTRTLAGAVLALMVFGLGMVPTGNASLLQDQASTGRGMSALERSFLRTASMASSKEYSEGSFSIRWVMWKATGRMILAHPLAGVGAGAWEVDIPLYQAPGSQLETDYYVHNEILQLAAEYGVVGWLFLAALLAYLAQAAWRTWRAPPEMHGEALVRALALAALLAFLIVSNAGFPWRLAATGALFALALAVLLASDARWPPAARGPRASALPWSPNTASLAVPATLCCIGLAGYISVMAIQSESAIVRAIKIALTISADGDPTNPRWDGAKAEVLSLTQQGIAINPHYRKLTPMVGDNLANWGDWKNAIWVWESVAQSRPYVVAILANIGRGYIAVRNFEGARKYLERARKVQADATVVHSLEVILLARTGQFQEATEKLRAYLDSGVYDYDLVHSAYWIGMQTRDWQLALEGLRLTVAGWPEQAPRAWVDAGNLYARELRDESRAMEAYRQALRATPAARVQATRQTIPSPYRERLGD